jgi:large subunit ribosomal protein L10
MVAILQVNSILAEDFFKVQVELFKKGMHIKKYGRTLFKKAVDGTKYECLEPLNINDSNSTAYVFSTEHKNVNDLMKILKKHHQYHLLCGIVEDRLLSRKELIEYGNLPDIQVARAQFANVLNLAASQLVQNLESHQASFVNILDAYVRENSKENVSESAKKEET